MDKYEYKLRLEEIRTLNKKGRFQEAAQVADTVDWNKVRNVSTLCVISDVYKINRRFEDARAMLLLANEKSPNNRRISYALCDLTIKMGQVVEAVEYYKEFVQQAPNDNSRYILLYKIYEAQDISLEERIAVLKEYKKREYNEKWAYELAFLYHRVGLATECIEECDQLILWFGEGKYVIKAMELKQLYAALSPAQQQSYDRMTGRRTEPEPEELAPEAVKEDAEEAAPQEIREAVLETVEVQSISPDKKPVSAQEEELDIHVKPMDMGEYNTINLQAALAESMKEVLEPETAPQDMVQQTREAVQQVNSTEQDKLRQPDSGMRQIYAREKAEARLEEYGGENAEYLEDVTRVIVDSEDLTNGVTGQLEEEETERVLRQVEQQAAKAETVPESVPESDVEIEVQNEVQQPAQESLLGFGISADNSMDSLLAQEYDGQISLALPEARTVEKQITGQMNIEDVLLEWERMKEENARRRRENTREWMMQQTGSLFTEFEQQSRDGVLEKLEREAAAYEERVRRQKSADAAKAAKPVQAAEELDSFEQDAEVEELEEIQELQTDHWESEAVNTEASQVDENVMQESPRPVNAAAKAVMAAAGGAIAADRAAADDAEQKLQSKQPEASETTPETAEAVQAQSSIQETEEEGQSEQPAAQEKSAEGQEESSAAQEKSEDAQNEHPAAEKEAVKETENHEDTEAFHARIREQQIQEHMRHMSREEKEMFAPYVPTRGAMRQLVGALDSISLSAFTGNVILTGAPGSDTMGLARNMIRSVRNSNNNFSGKVAKISGDILNEKSASEVISRIAGGALIIERAGRLSAAGAAGLAAALNQEHTGVIVFIMDTKKAIERLMDRCAPLADSFTARFDIAALDSSTLVKYGCQYAYNQEFAIDELGRLALHTRIEDMQTSEHAVTVEEVREIIDEAIAHATRFSLRHFWDIILRRRYDEDDMIVLRERDFA